ncbi:MAG: hypothetical protein DMG05_21960 [Acidobacteria bacterium]|nr:MAG: hypothetical protein DMG05_21960 [Acidobacteriota bacterium]
MDILRFQRQKGVATGIPVKLISEAAQEQARMPASIECPISSVEPIGSGQFSRHSFSVIAKLFGSKRVLSYEISDTAFRISLPFRSKSL